MSLELGESEGDGTRVVGWLAKPGKGDIGRWKAKEYDLICVLKDHF